jgi:putative ABC transport system permease protein
MPVARVNSWAARSHQDWSVLQIALTLPLLVAAMLLTRSFLTLADVDPGFRPANLVSFNLAIPRSRYRTDDQVAAFCRQIVERVGAIEGVRAAGMVNRLPLGGVAQTLLMDFDDRFDRTVPLDVDSRSTTPDYFRAMGIPLVAGRTFTDHDVATVPLPDLGNAPFPASAIIDDQLARKLWPDGNAVGHHLRLAFPHAPWVEIVGVVGHIRHDGLDVDPRPQVYFNSLQRPQDRMALVVRSDAPPQALMSRVVKAIRDLDPEQPVYDVRTMDDVVSASIADRRTAMALIGILAAAALVLAAVGLFGSVSYAVLGRTREYGIRMATGATRRMVLKLVAGSALRLATAGVVIGLLAAIVVSRTIHRLLFGVQPFDAISYASAVLTLIAVVLVASLVPARRAASVDPAAALRVE